MIFPHQEMLIFAASGWGHPLERKIRRNAQSFYYLTNISNKESIYSHLSSSP